MGGSIEVLSEPGEGSVFAVTLPRARSRGGAAAAVSPPPGMAGLEDEHPVHVVLYAEDNRLNIELVQPAAGAAQRLRAARRAQRPRGDRQLAHRARPICC